MALLLVDDVNDTYPGIEPVYLLAEKIVAGTASILSVLGALLVIFSFAYNSKTEFSFKELYYKICCGYEVKEKVAREQENLEDGEVKENDTWVTKYKLKAYNFILINLSVADIIVALSHFWGLLSNLEHKFSPSAASLKPNDSLIVNGNDVSCTTQGAFTALSTMASFFWTDILAVYLVFNMVCKGCTNNHLSKLEENINNGNRMIIVEERNCCNTPFFLYVIFPFFGWGIPMIMLVVFAIKGMLGYAEDYDGGMIIIYYYCTISYYVTPGIICKTPLHIPWIME